MRLHDTSQLIPSVLPNADPSEMALPSVDVRTRLNDRAMRGWSESTRRLARVVALFTSDCIAGVTGVWIVQNTWTVVSAGGRRPIPDEIPLIATVFCLMPLALRVTGAYAGGKARTDLSKIGAGVCVACFLGWLQAQLFGGDVATLPNKAAYVYSAATITALAWLLRGLLDWAVRTGYSAGALQRRVVVVGSAGEAAELHRRCVGTSGCDLRVVGRVAPTPFDLPAGIKNEDDHPDVPHVGNVDTLEHALSTANAHAVIIVSGLPFNSLERLVADCFRLGATVSIVPQALKKLSGAQLEVRESTVGALLQLRPIRLAVPQLAIKRAMDVTLTAIGLVAILPLLALIAVAIKLDSNGPVLFRQVRIGVGGRRFEILKFRTMVVGADAQKASLQHLNEYSDPRLFKIKRDPRVTSLGRVLRRLSLDELPQLWNVMRGDMSLVGPRPCVPEEFEKYAPHHMERLFVIPGVTGPWQVNGRNAITDFEQVVRLDQEYIRSWTISRDLVILFKTVPTLFRGGAY